MRASTSILKDTSGASQNTDSKTIKEDISVSDKTEESKMIIDYSKKKEKKKKRGKSDEKHAKKETLQAVVSSPGPVTNKTEKLSGGGGGGATNISFPLNLSTEESGYESDLTRKTSSKVRAR